MRRYAHGEHIRLTKDTPSANLLAMSAKSKQPKWSDLVNAGVSRSFASDLLSGRRLPSLETAVDLENKLSIRPRWWIERREQAA